MVVRLSLLVAATVAALAIKQQANSPKPPRPKPSEKKEVKSSKHGPEEEEEEEEEERLEEPFADFFSFEQDDEEEDDDEDKVKTVSSAISSAQSNLPLHGLAGDEELLLEFEDILSGEVELPLRQHGPSRHESNAPELERLRRLVNELEELDVRHEGELLEYYGLKEQEPDVAELRKQLEITAAEVEALNATVSSLRAERERIEEAAKAELEAAKGVVAELERQAARLRAAAKGLEAEVVELRKRNRELEKEKEEMAMKLDAAESRAVALSINWP